MEQIKIAEVEDRFHPDAHSVERKALQLPRNGRGHILELTRKPRRAKVAHCWSESPNTIRLTVSIASGCKTCEQLAGVTRDPRPHTGANTDADLHECPKIRVSA
jgi:hypothetical protein